MFVALPAIMRWYVVYKGKVPGVYRTWDECNNEVHGVRGAKHQSFSSFEQAWEAYISYLAAEGIQPTGSPVQPAGSPVTR